MTYDTHYKHACDVVIHRMHIRIVGVDLAAAARLQLAICIDRCGQCCVSLQAHPAPEIIPLPCSSEVLTSEFCCSAALLASVGCEEFQPFRVCGRLLLYILLQYADLAAAAFFLNAFLAGFLFAYWLFLVRAVNEYVMLDLIGCFAPACFRCYAERICFLISGVTCTAVLLVLVDAV